MVETVPKEHKSEGDAEAKHFARKGEGGTADWHKNIFLEEGIEATVKTTPNFGIKRNAGNANWAKRGPEAVQMGKNGRQPKNDNIFEVEKGTWGLY